jgi:hypothetical protein
MDKLTQMSSVFSPALANTAGGTTIAKAKTRLSTPVYYYVPTGNFTRDQVLDIALACAVACTSPDVNLAHWKNLIATYTNALFQGIVSRLPKDQFVPVKLTTEALARFSAAFSQLDAESDSIEDQQGLPAGALTGLTLPWSLPSPDPASLGGWVTYCRDTKVLFAHYALVVFLAGKQISDTNRVSITENRPRALIQKFKLEALEILTGHARISDNGHSQLNQAWLEMSSLKAECFREFSTFSHSSTDLGQDILLTNVNMMRFGQMQHATIIHKFLLAYPWASEMQALRQSISVYFDSINAALKVESHLQPFIKIIWGDKSGLFPRKELGPLIAVALDMEKEVHESLANYYSDERFVSVIEAFKEERERRAAKHPHTQPPVAAGAPSLDMDSEVEEDDDNEEPRSEHDPQPREAGPEEMDE